MKKQTLVGIAKGTLIGLGFLTLAGCGDYFSLLSGQEPCSKWTDQQKPDNSLHDASVKWATSFFPAFAGKYCQNGRKCETLQFPQDNERLLKSMQDYCTQNPDAKIMNAASMVMVTALRPAT